MRAARDPTVSPRGGRSLLELRKWYLDGVSPAGDVCIGYSAALRIGPFTTGYRGLLLRGAQGSRQERSRWGGSGAPRQDEMGAWHWSEWMQGQWQPLTQGMDSLLWQGPGARIHWHCLAPRCRTKLQSNCAGEPVDWAMDGYLERLELSLSTLALPLRQLRWGRAIMGEHSLVWIDWDLGSTLCQVWLDGVAVPARLQGDAPDSIAGADWALDLQRSAVLQERELGRMLPQSVRHRAGALARLRETKWLARAALRRPDGARCSGWAIFESVAWH